jgi:hypothetical protein
MSKTAVYLFQSSVVSAHPRQSTAAFNGSMHDGMTPYLDTGFIPVLRFSSVPSVPPW